MIRFKITLHQHGFNVRVNFEQDKNLMTQFCSDLDVYEYKWNPRTKRTSRIFKLSYSTYIPQLGQYGIHRSLFGKFRAYLKASQIPDSAIDVTIVDTDIAVGGNLLLKPESIPRDKDQEAVIDFVCAPGSTKVLPLQMGVGKTFCALYSVVKMGVRASLTAGARHTGTWVKDIKKFYLNGDSEVRIIRGRKDFRKLILDALDGSLDESFIVFTSRTMMDYLSDYEANGVSSYGCAPDKLYQLIGVGIRIVDEAHENLHFNFRHDIHTHVPKVLYLSATIQSKDAFKNQMYEVIFPIAHRYTGMEWKKYTVIKAISYALKEPSKAKYMGSMGYSQLIYEEWIMSDKKRLQSYLYMIFDLLQRGYLRNYQKGQKALIYIASVDLCEVASIYIKERIKPLGLSCHAFNANDTDQVLVDYDVIISTIGKSGSGKDIAGLVYVLSTIAIDSMESNLQMMGRLRPIDKLYPGVDPVYMYTVCVSIKKHRDYHNNRVSLYTPLVKTIKSSRSPYVI